VSKKYNVKDVVVLRTDMTQKGTIVECMRGKCKILWDRDWRTGRTYTHKHQEIVHLN
jgi:hypothetical protein